VRCTDVVDVGAAKLEGVLSPELGREAPAAQGMSLVPVDTAQLDRAPVDQDPVAFDLDLAEADAAA